MKSIYHICAMAAIAALALSCAKDKAPVEMKTISVTLGCPQVESMSPQAAPASKTVLDGTSVLWHASDVNIIAFTTAGNKYALTSSDNTKTAVKTFTGTIPATEEILFYYYDKNKTNPDATLKSNSYLREILVANQYVMSANGFHQNLNSAIAKPGDAAFRHVHGFIKWTNNGDAIKQVKLETVTEHEYFAGYFDVHYDGTDPETSKFLYNETNVNACSPHVTVVASESTIPSGGNYYAIVIPGTYHGMKVTVTKQDNSSISFKTNETFTVERGKYLDLGVLPITAP